MLSLIIVAIALPVFLMLGATPFHATAWIVMCLVYAKAATHLTRVTGKTDPNDSVAYAATYFGSTTLWFAAIYFFFPGLEMTIILGVFLAGLLTSQFLAQALFGKPDEVA